jgi:hypothetical protein
MGLFMSVSSALAAEVNPGVYYFACNYRGASEGYEQCFAQARLYWDELGPADFGDGPSINPPNRLQVICDGERLYNAEATAFETLNRVRIAATSAEAMAILLPVGASGHELRALSVGAADPMITTSWLDLNEGTQLRGYCEVRRGRRD